MTLRAVARRRCLMVADLTAARRDECEARVGAACDVTGEAGELLVAIVGEGVNGGREPGAGSRGRAGRIRVALPFPFRCRALDQRDTPQRARGIERLRWIYATVRSALHRGVAPGTVARIDLRSVRKVTQRTLLRHGAVRLPHVERFVTPARMTAGGRATL